MIALITLILIISVGFEVQAADNRQLVISDVHPYPGKFNLTFENHPVNEFFPVYIYITNNGLNVTEHETASDITLTLSTSSGDLLSTYTDIRITEQGYEKVYIQWPSNVQVILSVTGSISGNTATSTYTTPLPFWIGDPTAPPPTTGVGQILWEKEVF
jgi:hypothetical protein